MWKITGEILNPTWQNIMIYFKGGTTFVESQSLEKCYEYVDVNMYMSILHIDAWCPQSQKGMSDPAELVGSGN